MTKQLRGPVGTVILVAWLIIACIFIKSHVHPIAMCSQEYKPVLIVVDFQEDFCPPVSVLSHHSIPSPSNLTTTPLQNGSLAVPEGRSIAPILNNLLSLPFALKLATRDWHPRKHVSFASNHGPDAKPFTSTTTITHRHH